MFAAFDEQPAANLISILVLAIFESSGMTLLLWSIQYARELWHFAMERGVYQLERSQLVVNVDGKLKNCKILVIGMVDYFFDIPEVLRVRCNFHGFEIC